MVYYYEITNAKFLKGVITLLTSQVPSPSLWLLMSLLPTTMVPSSLTNISLTEGSVICGNGQCIWRQGWCSGGAGQPLRRGWQKPISKDTDGSGCEVVPVQQEHDFDMKVFFYDAISGFKEQSLEPDEQYVIN